MFYYNFDLKSAKKCKKTYPYHLPCNKKYTFLHKVPCSSIPTETHHACQKEYQIIHQLQRPTLVVGYLEETKLYPILPKEQGDECAEYVIDTFTRCLDDRVIIWPHSLGSIVFSIIV